MPPERKTTANLLRRWSKFFGLESEAHHTKMHSYFHNVVPWAEDVLGLTPEEAGWKEVYRAIKVCTNADFNQLRLIISETRFLIHN